MDWDHNGSLSCEGGQDWNIEWIKKNRSEFEIFFETLR